MKDDKVELLVDPDLKDNYDYKEVEELIQVYPGHAYPISLCALEMKHSFYCMSTLLLVRKRIGKRRKARG